MKAIFIIVIALVLAFFNVVIGQGIVYNTSTLWTGNHDLVIEGNSAYCAFNNGLAIFDISDPAHPELTAQLFIQDSCMAIEKHQQYAYLAASGSGIAIANLTDRNFPTLENIVPTIGECQDLKIFDHYLITSSDSALQIFNIENIIEPTLTATFPQTDGNYLPSRVFVEADRAYWVKDNVIVFDISDPNSLNSIGAITGYDANIADVFVRNDTACVISRIDFDAGRFRIYDISEPASPVAIGECYAYGDLNSLDIIGDYAYLCGDHENMQIVDIRTPANPTVINNISEYNTKGCNGILISGNYAYLANSCLATFEIYDISNPMYLPLVGSFDSRSKMVTDIALDGTYAYAATGQTGLLIIDISSLSNPRIVASYVTDNTHFTVDKVSLNGQYAYLSEGSTPDKLSILDIGNPVSPALIGVYTLGPTTLLYDIFVDPPYAYLSCGFSGFQILDVSDPSNPQFVSSADPGEVRGVFVSGSYAYMACGSSGLKIFDISNPSSPSEIGSLPGSGVMILSVVGNYAYVVNLSGLSCVDISDPTAPSVLWDLPGRPTGLAIRGNVAYVTDRLAGTRIMDLSDPLNPVQLAAYAIPDIPEAVDIEDNLIAIADRSSLIFLNYPGYGCDYVPGDMNGSRSANGLDVTYGVSYFKGGLPVPIACNCPPLPYPFYGAGDSNGDCSFNGIDISFFIRYLKGYETSLRYCPSCPPLRRQ